ncbi:hypothetical protein [Salipaludibacillus daqingensis]|uniref:hypothetical protein n=1 Tax=Salipaludibacillus daqingensis TaxID=3041001 RepID=UPI0024749BCD|nr:hypothetical protein [Salipaludibacillus daqingensis]
MKKVFLLFISLSLLFVLASCNEDDGEEILSGIDSGTLDEEFEGVVNPELDVIYKLTDEEIEQGIAPLKMDEYMDESEIEDSEVSESEAEDEDGEDEDDESPKPNI